MKRSFGENWFARQQRLADISGKLERPRMMAIRPVRERD
jgi:hypothetical protein